MATFPIRQFDDKAVLRTDGTYPDINTAYAKSERIFDANDSPTAWPFNQKDAYGNPGPRKVTMHQKSQMRTGPGASENDPSKMVDQGYTDPSALL